MINDKTSIAVSITNSLFAFGLTPFDTTQVTRISAMLSVGITPIPEPGTAVLVMTGLPGLAARRR
jgi:hypothetical protein